MLSQQAKSNERKGCWTYAEVPELKNLSRTNFGWVRIKGTIDNYELTGYSLAPMKDGKLFPPVKAGFRQKIRKQAGDYIQVILYRDYSEFAFRPRRRSHMKLSNTYDHLRGRKKSWNEFLYKHVTTFGVKPACIFIEGLLFTEISILPRQ